MAWITINRSEARASRREEPYLDEMMQAELDRTVLSRYPTRRAAVLPVLHKLQDRWGFLTYQAIDEAAAYLDISPAELLDTVSFYEEFTLKPLGKYVIRICRSLSCELMGSGALEQMVKDKLGIEVGETTADKRFTLMNVECLGSCGTAPCALIDEMLFEDLDAETFGQIIDSLD